MFRRGGLKGFYSLARQGLALSNRLTSGAHPLSLACFCFRGCKICLDMKIETDTMFFQYDESYASGLPLSLPLDLVEYAFNCTRRARGKCSEEFNALLDDIDLISHETRATLPSYASRIESLDNLSFTLALLTDDIFMQDNLN